MSHEKLEKNLIDLIKEEQAKLGYQKESVRLYYPLSSLLHFYDCNDRADEMQNRLSDFSSAVADTLGEVEVSHRGDRFCFLIPESGTEYVHTRTSDNEFITQLVALIGSHHTTMEQIKELFESQEAACVITDMDCDEFDVMIRFTAGEDPYYYCFKDEGCHIIYHRFLPEDYMDFGLFSRKIAVVGIGGVGGFLAGAIGTAYEKELTLVARGDRLKTLKEQGLVLHSELRGEITVHPRAVVCAQELEEQDVIFLCVKNYSLEEACDQIRHAVGEHTIVIPVMNGVDPGDRVRAALGRGIVVDSLIYIVAFIGTDGSIVHQGDFARMRIGIKHATVEEQQAVTLVSDILTGAGVEHLVADDIELEIWRKYILNCAYNVATAAYDNNIGQLRADPQKAKEFEDLVTEAYEVAKAKGVAVLPEHRDEFFDRFHHVYRNDATSSLQRDLNAGKRAEIETFSGYLVREAERLGIAAPVSEKMYGLLKQRALQD